MSRETDLLAAVREDPAGTVIGVDFDGTLAAIVARPEAARPVAGAREVLGRLAARLGRVAVISGRAASDVVTLGGLDGVDGLRVLGHYGLESWHAGSLDSPEPAPGVAQARHRLPELLAAAAAGVFVEDKTHSLVVHTRQADDPAGELERLTPRLQQLAGDAGLEAVPGKFVLELRPGGVDKGTALRQLADGARTVVYVGDDLGDLPAFDTVAALRRTGMTGLSVASIDPADSSAPAELRERADVVLPGPAGVVRWLEQLLSG